MFLDMFTQVINVSIENSQLIKGLQATAIHTIDSHVTIDEKIVYI